MDLAALLTRLYEVVAGPLADTTLAAIAAISFAACAYTGYRAWLLAQDGDAQGDSGGWVRLAVAFGASALLGVVAVLCAAMAFTLTGD